MLLQLTPKHQTDAFRRYIYEGAGKVIFPLKAVDEDVYLLRFQSRSWKHLYKIYPPVSEILNRQITFNCASPGTIRGFYFGENCVLLASSLVSLGKNVPICLALRYLRLEPVGWYNTSSLQHTLPATHKRPFIHTVFPFFFALSPLSLPFSFLLCQSRLCVSMALCCALWWAHFRHSCVSQECFSFQ